MRTVEVALVLLAFPLLASSGQSGEERHKWWQAPAITTEVGLSPEQSQELESVFQASLPKMRAEKEELDRQERALSQLMTEARVDEAGLGQAIDRVEAARAKAIKTRMLMLYRMYRVLTPDQRVKLEAVQQRLRREHRSYE